MIATDDGLVMVDTGSIMTAEHVHREVRAWSDQPLRSAIFSHGHIDHVFGVGPFDEEAKSNGWRAPHVIAHRHLPERFERYVMTAGYNQIINRRQFGARISSGRSNTASRTKPTRSCTSSSVGSSTLAAPPRKRRDRRRDGDVDSRAPGALFGRPLHLEQPQRGQPPEGAALSARMGPGASTHGRPRGGVSPPRPRSSRSLDASASTRPRARRRSTWRAWSSRPLRS